MAGITYKGLMVREIAENQFARAVEELSTDQLPAGDVLVKVLFSSLNYKDMLSAYGNRGVTKNIPTPPASMRRASSKKAVRPTSKPATKSSSPATTWA